MVEYGSKSNVIFQVIDLKLDDIKQTAGSRLEEAGDKSAKGRITDEFVQARTLTCDTA